MPAQDAARRQRSFEANLLVEQWTSASALLPVVDVRGELGRRNRQPQCQRPTACEPPAPRLPGQGRTHGEAVEARPALVRLHPVGCPEPQFRELGALVRPQRRLELVPGAGLRAAGARDRRRGGRKGRGDGENGQERPHGLKVPCSRGHAQDRGHVQADRRPAAGDRELSASILAGERYQTLLGATGTGKTATMAWIIEKVGRPALVIAHNKTLAAQLCNEFREFFPANAVEYFVSYYDYYQPEAYVPQADLYIEKDSSRNDDIDRLRHAATSSLLSRRDTIIVASVSRDLRPRLARGVREARRPAHGRRGDRPRPDAAQADRHPVRAQRHGARPRPVPRQAAT